MMEPFKLHPSWEQFTGHCQITYTTKNSLNQKLIYCLQDNGKAFGGIRLLRCTQDGEPSHDAHPKSKLIFERPPITDELTKLVNEWIDLNCEPN